MIPSPDQFRAWKDFGTRGLDEVERYARTEYRDGNLAWMEPAARALESREPTLLRRLVAAIHFRPARSHVPASSAVGHIHPGISAVHFADEPRRHVDPCAHAPAATVLLVSSSEDLETCDLECQES